MVKIRPLCSCGHRKAYHFANGGGCFACPASVTRCPLYDPKKLELVPS